MAVSGVIVEVGEQRLESVSLSGNLAAQQMASGCLAAPFRALGILAGVLFAPFRVFLLPSLTPRRRADGPDRMQIPGQPFLVQVDDGTDYDCYLRGELRGGYLRMGDRVEVNGRIDRHGILRVSKLVSVRTGSISRGYVDPKARYANARGVLALLLILFVIYVVVSISR